MDVRKSLATLSAIVLVTVGVSGCGSQAPTSSQSTVSSMDAPPVAEKALESHDAYVHDDILARGVAVGDLAAASAMIDMEVPVPPGWPDPDEVRVSDLGDRGIIMVWEHSPEGLVAIIVDDSLSRNGGSFEGFVQGIVDSHMGTPVSLGSVDGVLVRGDTSQALYFTKGDLLVSVHLDARVDEGAIQKLGTAIEDSN